MIGERESQGFTLGWIAKPRWGFQRWAWPQEGGTAVGDCEFQAVVQGGLEGGGVGALVGRRFRTMTRSQTHTPTS